MYNLPTEVLIIALIPVAIRAATAALPQVRELIKDLWYRNNQEKIGVQLENERSRQQIMKSACHKAGSRRPRVARGHPVLRQHRGRNHGRRTKTVTTCSFEATML
jgi:hypothetical protein